MSDIFGTGTNNKSIPCFFNHRDVARTESGPNNPSVHANASGAFGVTYSPVYISLNNGGVPAARSRKCFVAGSAGSVRGAASAKAALEAKLAARRVSSSAALAEFRAGDADRGRALYEGVLRAAPRRTDLWAVYADQEIRRGEPARVRAPPLPMVRAGGGGGAGRGLQRGGDGRQGTS